MKSSRIYQGLLVIMAVQIAALASAAEHFTFTQSYLVQRNLEIPAERLLFPRMTPPNRHLLNGQLVFSNGAEFEGNEIKELPASQVYCLVNAVRNEEAQAAWEAKVPFRIEGKYPYSAPLRRVGYGSDLQTLEVLGNQTILIIACLRHLGEGQSQPLPLTEKILRSAFGDRANWEINGLPKDRPVASAEVLRVGGFASGVVAYGPAFPRPSVIVKGDTQIVRGEGAITAGWLKIGSLKDAIQNIAFEAGVSVVTDSDANITGRTVTWVVQGTQENVDRFNRLIQVFIRANEPGSR